MVFIAILTRLPGSSS